ncbi:MAG: hypothetical protein AAF577_06295 [Pseudomonadota bacterium]
MSRKSRAVGRGGETPHADAAGELTPGLRTATLCLTAVTVAGQCRERSPVDKTVFGTRGDRFDDRFDDPAAARLLLAQAVAEGAAMAEMVVMAGAVGLPAQVALWRQRGGDRIRIVAAFALMPEALGGRDRSSPEDSAEDNSGNGSENGPWHGSETTSEIRPEDGASAPLGSDGGAGAREPGAAAPMDAAIAGYARQLRRTVDAALGQMAAGASGEGGAVGPDMAPPLWRVSSLASAIARHLPGRPAGAGAVLAETDLALIVRRVMALHAASAAGHGVRLAPPPVRTTGQYAVMVDQQALWGALEALIDLARVRLGHGGSIDARIAEAGSVALTISLSVGRSGSVPAVADFAEVATLAGDAGMAFTFVADEGADDRGGDRDGHRAECQFIIGAERCLPPV